MPTTNRKPYYDEGGIRIYHGDAREVMSEHIGWFDACVTDPPYGETSLDWDVRVAGWLGLLPSNQLWCFGSLRSFLAQPFTGWRHVQEIVWEKHNGSGFHADRFKRVHELAVHFIRETTQWSAVYHAPVYTNDATKRQIRRKQRPPHTGHIERGIYASQDGGPRLMRSVIQARSCHGYAEHPTQKPVAILRPLIEYSCPPGGVVLDPFMGSGSTLRAAKDAGRFAVGIEVEERWCEVAAKRLAQEAMALWETRTARA